MRKEIDVFNAYFGDCIILKDIDDSSNLLVDFGIHYNSVVSSVYKSRNDLTDSIAKDISSRFSNKNLSLLITHFHEDHVSGLIYMYQSKNPAFKNLFRNIYIANIWNNPFAVASNLLEEILLKSQLKNGNLPRTNATLFDLLGFLHASKGKIMLLSRGETFEDKKYIALWPKKKNNNSSLIKLFNSLNLPDEFREDLIKLAEMTCVYVIRVLLEGEHYEAEFLERYDSIPNLERLYNMYRDLFIKFIEAINSISGDEIDNTIKKLHKLNHKYNIVFQNVENSDQNILFTGDAEKSHMKNIANATDIRLYREYKYIKIPHHGTKAHYFDFSSYGPRYIVITNGKVNTSHANSYRIFSKYKSISAFHVCANSNNCCSCLLNKCPCAPNCMLIYKQYCITI